MFETVTRKKQRHFGTGRAAEGIYLSLVYVKDKVKTGRLQIRFAQDVLKRQRWTGGDLVEMAFSREDRLLGFRRTNDRKAGMRIAQERKNAVGVCSISLRLLPDDLASIINSVAPREWPTKALVYFDDLVAVSLVPENGTAG